MTARTSVKSVHRFAWFAAIVLALAPLAFAGHHIDAKLVVDPVVFDVREPAEPPERAGVILAFNGTDLEFRVVEAGSGSLPDIDIDFVADEVPRIEPFERVHLSAALRLTPTIDAETFIGGVVVEHRDVTLPALRSAYAAALMELGFELSEDSTYNRWIFVNDVGAIRVTANPNGTDVTTYVGR